MKELLLVSARELLNRICTSKRQRVSKERKDSAEHLINAAPSGIEEGRGCRNARGAGKEGSSGAPNKDTPYHHRPPVYYTTMTTCWDHSRLHTKNHFHMVKEQIQKKEKTTDGSRHIV